MRIGVSGASGLIGRALVPSLKEKGHEVVRLVRRKPSGADQIAWQPNKGVLDPSALEGLDALVHLSGENLADGRWTDQKKRAIYQSRVKSTKLLADVLCQLKRPPRTWLCASAVGFYGDRGDEKLTEESLPRHDFLADVCSAWEKATEPAVANGVRVVNLRFGPVLTTQGGLLQKLLGPFRAGFGGPVGGGRQYISWVALEDTVSVIQHCLATQNLSGPVNVVSPNPVTNETFAKTLGAVLNRPTFARVPGFVVRMMMGREFADSLVLASQRALPVKLKVTGYEFLYPELAPTLRHLLGK